MRVGICLLLIMACLGGCTVPRTFVPVHGGEGFDNASGMELEPGDRVIVTLSGGSTLAGVFSGLEDGHLVIMCWDSRQASLRVPTTIPLTDVEKVVCKKTSVREGFISVLFLVPVTLIIVFLISFNASGMS